MALGRKTGGRAKGTPNKATARSRALVLRFLEARSDVEINLLWEAAKAESPKDAFRMWLQAQEFVLPRLARSEVEATGAGGGPLVVQVVNYSGKDQG